MATLTEAELRTLRLLVLYDVYCHRSIREIAIDINKSVSVVQRALKYLEGEQLVSNPRTTVGKKLARGRVVTDKGMHELRRAHLVTGRTVVTNSQPVLTG